MVLKNLFRVRYKEIEIINFEERLEDNFLE